MKRALLGMGLLAAMLGIGCEAPPTIDRTRPDYIRKSDLTQGTWYLMETVVDVPPTSDLAFEGMQGELAKVRFEVQENHLVAFRAYEHIVGTDPLVDGESTTPGGTVGTDGQPYRGAPLYAWKIESHFDRQRQYNPSTGEQTNVLEENSSDRPWYDREFIRVAWGQNVIKNHFSLSGGPLDGTNGKPSLTPYVSPLDSEEGEDEMEVEYEELADGKKQLKYLDFTARQFWEPASIEYPGYGQVKLCLLADTYDCAGQVVRVRTSMKRVDEAAAKDYEPLRYDNMAMTKFGFFRTERDVYTRERGMPESARILLANRHNIWQRAHDENGNTIPVASREVRPVVYHLSANFPADMVPAAKRLEAEYDRVFKQAVAVARNPANPDPASVKQQMFVLCANPGVKADPEAGVQGDPEVCNPGKLKRIGDLRYNFLAWVDDPQAAGPLGYGPSSADPETGEIIQAGAYIYGAQLDAWAGDAQQVMEVLSGITPVEDLVSGKATRDYVSKNLSPTDTRRLQSGPWESQQGLTSEPTAPLTLRLKGTLAEALERAKDQNSLPQLAGDSSSLDARVAAHPDLESALTELPEVRAAVLSLAPSDTWRQRLESDPMLYRTMARQTLLRMEDILALQKERHDWASRHNIWLADFSDDAWYGLAKEKAEAFRAKVDSYKGQGLDEQAAQDKARADIYLEIRQAGFESVAEHEVGHTVGLRHNFQGSYDALNFKDGYWQLRQQTIGVMAGGKRVFPVEPEDLALQSQLNEAQKVGKMSELQYSTVMDYGARMNGSIHGLGKYDQAAILFAYAGGPELGYVEVFKDTRSLLKPHLELETTASGQKLRVRGAQVQMPVSNALHTNMLLPSHGERFHYTTVPFQLADADLGFEEALAQGVDRIDNRAYAKWSDVEAFYKKFRDAYDAWLAAGAGQRGDTLEMTDLITQVARSINDKQPTEALRGLIEVPYMFCTDSEAGGILTCNRFDAGADPYEMTRNWIDQYENYYVFSNFRRNRYFFSVNTAFNRNFGRLMSNFPAVFYMWMNYQYWNMVYGGETPESLHERYGIQDTTTQAYTTMSVFDGLNTLMRTLTAAVPGYYGKVAASGTEPARWVRLEGENLSDSRRLSDYEEDLLRNRLVGTAPGQYAELAYVPRGRSVRNPYTLFETEGYDFYRRVNEVGHFWDQYGALIALTRTTTNLVGVDRGADSLRYSLPYYLAFPKDMNRVFGGFWSLDHAKFSPALVQELDEQGRPSGLARVETPVQVRAQDYLEGFNWPPEPTLPRDGVSGQPVVERAESTPAWGARLYSQLFGMAFFSSNLSLEYAHLNQVYRRGSNEAVTPIEGWTELVYNDRFGGYVYSSLVQTGSSELTPAATLVQKAEQTAQAWEAEVDASRKAQLEAELRELTRLLEISRTMYEYFGSTAG